MKKIECMVNRENTIAWALEQIATIDDLGKMRHQILKLSEKLRDKKFEIMVII